jgi:NAD+ kinase
LDCFSFVCFVCSDPGRPLVYELIINDSSPEIQRSSGLLVCTGTGSTAWMSNAAGIDESIVSSVLRDINYSCSPAECRQISERLNRQLVYETNSNEIQYFVREPIVSSAHHGTYKHRHGWAKTIAIRSLGW